MTKEYADGDNSVVCDAYGSVEWWSIARALPKIMFFTRRALPLRFQERYLPTRTYLADTHSFFNLVGLASVGLVRLDGYCSNLFFLF